MSASVATPPPTTGDEAGWQHSFVVQMAVALVVTTAVQAIRPTVTYRAIDLGAGPVEIGIVQSAYSLMPALAAVPVGRWVDTRGEVPFLRLAMVAIVIGSILETVSESLVMLVVSQLVLGLGQILNLVAAQALVANRGPRDRRDTRYGTYFTTNSFGQLLGPAAGGLIAGGSIGALLSTDGARALPFVGSLQDPNSWVFLAATAISAVALGLTFLIPVGHPPRHGGAADIAAAPGGLLAAMVRVVRRRGMPSAMLVSITVISCVDVLIAYLPAYGDAVGLSVGLVGLLLSVRAASSLVSRIFMTPLVRRFGRERVLTLSLVLAAIGLGVIPLTSTPVLLIALMVVAGLGLGLGQPMTIAWVADRSPRRERGIALGVRIMGNRGSTLVVPTAMGAVAGAAGLAAIFLVLAGCLGAATVVAGSTRFDELIEPPPEPLAT